MKSELRLRNRKMRPRATPIYWPRYGVILKGGAHGEAAVARCVAHHEEVVAMRNARRAGIPQTGSE